MKKLSDEIERIINQGIKKYGTARKLAEVAGTEPSNLSRWRNGSRMPTINEFSPVMFAAGVDLQFMEDEILDYDIVVKRAAKAGAGSSLETGEEVDGYFAFRRDWLHKIGVTADKAVMIDVVGDSMEPILKAGDTLLVDMNDKTLLNGQIYVVTLWDELLVKRVIKEMAGIYLHSENVRYPDICIAAADLPQLEVHGRVRWVGKEI